MKEELSPLVNQSIAMQEKWRLVHPESEIDLDIQVIWNCINHATKEMVLDYAKKLIQEGQMTYAVSQLLPLGLSLEKCQEIEACIKANEPVYCCLENVFMDDKISFKIQQLINLQAKGQLK